MVDAATYKRLLASGQRGADELNRLIAQEENQKPQSRTSSGSISLPSTPVAPKVEETSKKVKRKRK